MQPQSLTARPGQMIGWKTFFPFKIVHFRGYVKLESDNSELKERPEVKPKQIETNDHDYHFPTNQACPQ